MGRKFTSQTAPPVVVTRGGAAFAAGLAEFLAVAGYDMGDGTAALGVYVTGGENGGANTANAIVVTTTKGIVAGAPAVQITQLTPATTLFQAIVQNTGAVPLWIGPAGVTDQTGASPGFLIASGGSESFPISSNVTLYAYVSSTATASGIATVVQFE